MTSRQLLRALLYQSRSASLMVGGGRGGPILEAVATEATTTSNRSLGSSRTSSSTCGPLKPLPVSEEDSSISLSFQTKRLFPTISRRFLTNEATSESSDNESSSLSSTKQQSARRWEDYYQALKQFQEEHGHTQVPQDYRSDPSLFYFVKKQKLQADRLSPEQKDMLNQLGFNWETRAERHERVWQERFESLTLFKEANGHCNIPLRYEADPSLGRWVDRQRMLYKQGLLPDERRNKLESVGFQWSLVTAPPRDTKTYDKKWNSQYQKLRDIYKETGSALLSPAQSEEDPSLGNWTKRQRVLYRQGLLREDRAQLLFEIGFVFDINKTNPDESNWQRQWDDMLEELEEYKNKHGHVQVPQSYKEQQNLGQWVATQRRRHLLGTLEPIREQRLEELGFFLSQPKTRAQMWEEKYQELQQFYKHHGHCLVSRTHADCNHLVNWVATQRAAYRDGILAPDRQAKLETLGFAWQVRARPRSPSAKSSTEADHDNSGYGSV